MADIKELRANYNALLEQKRQLQAAIEGAVAQMQSECPHQLEQIREANYEEDPLGGCYHQAPFRVCIDCGLAEEGWGSGYKLLAPYVYSEIPTITRDHGYRLRIGRTREQRRG